MTWLIDGGAHRGESIDFARRYFADATMGAIAVEPACECWPELATRGAIVIPAALSSRFGVTTFYRGQYEVSATTCPEKKTGGVDLASWSTVPTVTLGSLIAGLPSADRIVVKLDIEGAEYDVLETALDDRDLRRVVELFVDFHADRIPEFRDRHNRVVERLLAAGWKLEKWCPIDGTVKPWGRKWLIP